MSTDTPKICGATSPSFGPYGPTWMCHEVGWHRRHRHRNYTWPRVPQVWRVAGLLRTWDANKRLLKGWCPGTPPPGLLRYRGVLFPRRFEPLSNDELSVRMKREVR